MNPGRAIENFHRLEKNGDAQNLFARQTLAISY